MNSPASCGNGATWRKFGRQSVPKEMVGRLLHLSFGVQDWMRIPEGRAIRSARRLHPVARCIRRGLPACPNVQGVPGGIYHYDAVGHRLQEIRRGATPAEVQKLLAGQWWFRDAAFVVFLAAVFHRTQWKYDYPRAYRAVLAEGGPSLPDVLPDCDRARPGTVLQPWLSPTHASRRL